MHKFAQLTRFFFPKYSPNPLQTILIEGAKTENVFGGHINAFMLGPINFPTLQLILTHPMYDPGYSCTHPSHSPIYSSPRLNLTKITNRCCSLTRSFTVLNHLDLRCISLSQVWPILLLILPNSSIPHLCCLCHRLTGPAGGLCSK